MPQALELACCQLFTALGAAQNRFTRTCQHYPSVAFSSIPFPILSVDEQAAHSTKICKIVAPYRSQAGEAVKAVSGFRKTRCLLQGMLGVLGYCPTNIRFDFDPVGHQANPEISFLATAYEVYQRFCFRHNLAPSHSAQSVAAIRILSGALSQRNRGTVENTALLVEMSRPKPRSRR